MENCAFTDEEIEVFKLRRKGVSIVAISLYLQMSESAVKRRIHSIKEKIEEEKRYESGTNPN
jgi:DNA-binding NarL/FixJ family response regulator